MQDQYFIKYYKVYFIYKKKGIYHSQLSLETIYLDKGTSTSTGTTSPHSTRAIITQFDHAIRVPYNDPSNFGCIIGETEGTTRRLILQTQSTSSNMMKNSHHQSSSENLMYLAPEVLEQEHAIDGFAADIWSAGVILFILVVGMAPFKSAHYWDDAYAEISSGRLKQLLKRLNISLSVELINLLQNMFWRDPRDRLSLSQIMEHAWTKGKRFPPKPPKANSTISTKKGIPKSSLLTEKGLKDLAPSDASTASSSTISGSARTATGMNTSSGKRSSGFSRALSSMFGGGGSTSCGGCESPASTNTKSSILSKSSFFGGSSSRGGGSGPFSIRGSKQRRATFMTSSSASTSTTTFESPSSSTPAERKSLPKNLKVNVQMLSLPEL